MSAVQTRTQTQVVYVRSNSRKYLILPLSIGMMLFFIAGFELGGRTGTGIGGFFSYLESKFFTIRYVSAIRHEGDGTEYPSEVPISTGASMVTVSFVQQANAATQATDTQAVADDVSSDNTAAAVRSLEKKNPNAGVTANKKLPESPIISTTTATSAGSTQTQTTITSTTTQTQTSIVTNPVPATQTGTTSTASSAVPTTTPPELAVDPGVKATTTKNWAIQSVSSMKETKDKLCKQDSAEVIAAWVNRAVELGVNYIAVETPYDNPPCGSAVAYTKAWVDAIHAKGLNVWHRHMPLEFEGIYGTPKNTSKDYIALISNYIKANPTFFKEGDIFTPVPEPQNGGIKGITYCSQEKCMFDGKVSFNAWLRTAITSSEAAFGTIGLGKKIKIGYYGFDGFIAWGHNNPDWDGILEKQTIDMMGNITIDHYPELVGTTMAADLDELQKLYPNTQIVIGEWGTVTGGDTTAAIRTSMQAAIRPNIVGFNYWHMGMSGNEALINDDMTTKASYDAVKSFFKK